jgi:hypothetical protein
MMAVLAVCGQSFAPQGYHQQNNRWRSLDRGAIGDSPGFMPLSFPIYAIGRSAQS